MAVTTASVLSNSVATAYDKAYLYAFLKSRVWFDMVEWGEPVGGNLRGSTISQPVMEGLAPATTALTDGTDVTPVALDDSAVTLTIYEYGNAVTTTRFLDTVAFTDVTRGAATVVGQNQAASLDMLIRTAVNAGTLVVYGGTATSRATLDTTSDKITYAYIAQLAGMAAGMGIQPFEDGTYATIVHPALFQDFAGLAEWKAVGEYSDPKLIYMGKPGVLGNGGRFKNERGAFAGIRFIEHPYGKLFLSGGTPLQAATTLDGGFAAGATAIDVVSATGITVGDFITIGTLESATAEQVLVTAVATNALTIRGAGNAIGNFGLKYAHLTGVAVTEAPNVASIPVFGPSSIRGRFASDPGKNGQVAVEWANTAIPRRNLNHSWYWIGGFGIVDKYVIRGEVATTGNVYGDNK